MGCCLEIVSGLIIHQVWCILKHRLTTMFVLGCGVSNSFKQWGRMGPDLPLYVVCSGVRIILIATMRSLVDSVYQVQ